MARNEIKVAFVGDISGLSKAIGKVDKDLAGFQRSTHSAAKATTAFSASIKSGVNMLKVYGAVAAGALLVFGKSAIDAATSVEESLNKANVLFGQSSDEIQRWSEGLAASFGLSQRQALEAAGVFGNFFRTIGLGESDAAAMSQRLVELSADLASFNNVDPQEALDALRSGLSGEVEPLRRLGVFLNEATVKAKAMEMGLADGNGELSEAAKLQARYALILEQTGTAQGDFARTSDSLANQQRILNAEIDNLKVKLGAELAPIAKAALEAVLAGLAGLKSWWDENGDDVNARYEEFKTGLQTIKDWWDTDGKQLVEDFKTGWADFQAGLDNLARWFTDRKAEFEQGWADFTAGWQGVVDGITVIVDALVTQVSIIFGVLQTVATAIMGAIQAVIAFFTGDIRGALDGISQYLQAVWEFFQRLWDAISKLPALPIPGVGTIRNPFARADGGPVSAGQPYIVGERGPELFVPSQSGTVLPNGMSIGTVNFNVPASEEVAAHTIRRMRQMAYLQGAW